MGTSHAGFEEHTRGSVEPGKAVDLAVQSRDPAARFELFGGSGPLDAGALMHPTGSLKAQSTMAGGNIVRHASSLRAENETVRFGQRYLSAPRAFGTVVVPAPGRTEVYLSIFADDPVIHIDESLWHDLESYKQTDPRIRHLLVGARGIAQGAVWCCASALLLWCEMVS